MDQHTSTNVPHYRFHGTLRELYDRLNPATRITVGSKSGWLFYGTRDELLEDAPIIDAYYLDHWQKELKKYQDSLGENSKRVQRMNSMTARMEKARNAGDIQHLNMLLKEYNATKGAYDDALIKTPINIAYKQQQINNHKPLLERTVIAICDNVMPDEHCAFRVFVAGDENGMMDFTREYPLIRKQYIHRTNRRDTLKWVE